MRHITALVAAAMISLSAFAGEYSNAELGISFTFPDLWKEEDVPDENKPATVCKGVRDDNPADFFHLVIYPSNSADPSTSYLEEWAKETKKAFGAKAKSYRIMKTESGPWYQLVMSYKKRIIIYYQTAENGFTYNYTFLNSYPENEGYQKETEELIKSISFSRPENIDKVIGQFASMVKHSKTGIMMPSDMFLTSKIEKDLPPNVESLYYSVISDQSADYVLIADDYHEQLFGMNISLKMEEVDSAGAVLVAELTATAFKQEVKKYEELYLGSWAPDREKVFLYKFLLRSETNAVVYYIFYVQDDGKTHMYKYQVPEVLDKDLEPSIFLMMEESVKNL